MTTNPRVILGLIAAVAVGLASVLTVVHAGEGTAPKAKPAKDAQYTAAGVAKANKSAFRKHTPSPVIFPNQNIPLRFSHKLHIAQDVSCKDCHATASKSVRSKDNLLPVESTCLDCHDVEDTDADPPASCSTCHVGYNPKLPDGFSADDTHTIKDKPKSAIYMPPPHLKMNHKRHIDLGIECSQCHGTMKDIDFATRENALPTMKTCVGACHNGVEREFTEKGKKVKIAPPKECKTCHVTNGDGRLKTDYPTGQLKPAGHVFGDAHDENWLKNHKMVAGQNDEHCSNCHKPSWCVDCHTGIQKPLKVHPNNWILAHPVSARKNSPDCQSCHKTQTFCVDCHTSLKVGGDTVTNPNKPLLKGKFHPDGWASYAARGPNHHSFQAQRNIRACSSCHTEATCLACHTANGTASNKLNPHPIGFKGSADCKRMKRMNPRMCAKCHTAGDPNLTSCN